MKVTKYLAASFIALAGLSATSCSDSFLEVEDKDNMGEEAAGNVAAKSPEAYMNGIWSWMVEVQSTHDDFGYTSCLLAGDVMGEDMVQAGTQWFIYDYMLDNRMFNYRRTHANWNIFYGMVDKANAVIGLYPEGPKTAEETALVGQAQAVRGLAYLNLIQLFQNVVKADGSLNLEAPGVPLAYTKMDGKTEEEMAAAQGRNTVKEVFALIESDLTSAVAKLAGAGRPNKNFIDQSVANGILARYYLLTQQWQKAADAAAAARQGYPIMQGNQLFDGFVTVDNPEWMWGFKHTSETSSVFASLHSHLSNFAPGYAGIGMAPKCIDARLYSKIDENDVRKAWFNGPEGGQYPVADPNNEPTAMNMPYANLKFGYFHISNWEQNYLYMRASEMVLIEAEAYAHMENGAKAAEVLGELMSKRVEGWKETTVDVEDVYLQRRIELWGEGHTLFDLKRLNKGINRNYEGTNHMYAPIDVPAQSPLWTYQIPMKEILENDMISEDDQNP